MGYKHVHHNTTEQVKEGGLLGSVTGRNDAVFLRNKYQTLIDNDNADVVNSVHWLEENKESLNWAYNKAQGLKRNIEAHEEERKQLYQSLGNLLDKETGHEDKMWKTTVKGQKVNQQIKIKQKFKDADIDEMNYNTAMQYMEQYPYYISKSSFKEILEKIKWKEKEIREEKSNYNHAVSSYNAKLGEFNRLIAKSEENASKYEDDLNTGNEKLKQTRYYKWFVKHVSEKKKFDVTIDTSEHNLKKFKEVLNIIKDELSENKGKKFTTMDY